MYGHALTSKDIHVNNCEKSSLVF